MGSPRSTSLAAWSTTAVFRDLLGHRWHVVACIDPDGLRLNEGWLAGPFTRGHYLRHFYRSAGDEQIEWTFPVDHKAAYFDACPRRPRR